MHKVFYPSECTTFKVLSKVESSDQIIIVLLAILQFIDTAEMVGKMKDGFKQMLVLLNSAFICFELTLLPGKDLQLAINAFNI